MRDEQPCSISDIFFSTLRVNLRASSLGSLILVHRLERADKVSSEVRKESMRVRVDMIQAYSLPEIADTKFYLLLC